MLAIRYTDMSSLAIKTATILELDDKIRDPRQTNISPEHYF